MTKNIVFCVFVIVTGFIGYFFGRNSVVKICEPEVIERTIEIPIEKIKTVEVPSSVKSEEAILMFLAAIGVNLKNSHEESIKKLAQKPELLEREVENAEVLGPNLVNEQEPVSSNPMSVYMKNPRFEFFGMDKENDSKEKINSVVHELNDPALYSARAKPLSDMKLVKTYIGNYSGKLFYLKSKYKGEVHDIKASIDFYEDNKKINGHYFMSLTDESGRSYSTKRGEGGNQDIRKGRDVGVILDASPSSYFHFYDNSMRRANFYDEGKLVGYAIFERKY